MEEWRAGYSGGGLRSRLEAAVKRGQLSLPPPDEDDEPEPEGIDEDGVPLAAKQAAKAIRELEPPDPAHPDDRLAAAGYAEQYSIDDDESPWAGQPDEAEKRAATLRWVQAALERTAAHDTRFKRPLLYVLANDRLWPDQENPEEPGFAQLKAFAGAKLDALGEAAEREIYAALGLGPKLDGVCADVENVHPRQDVHAGLAAATFEFFNDLQHAFKLLIAAHALDAGFQAKAAAAFVRAGGTGAGKPPAVKGFMRMMAKLQTDHADADEPKPYENADTNRVAWVLEDAEQLIKAEAEARTELGPPIRCKNNYQQSFDASLTKGYRAMLCNYVYDSQKTWGELESEVRAAEAEVKRLVLGVFAGAGAPEDDVAEMGADIDTVAAEFGVDMREPGWKGVLAGAGWDDATIAARGAAIDKALGDSAAMRESPAKLVVEIQFMTKEYYAMRKKTHAWYKVVRADHANGMVIDYAGGL